MNGANDKDDDPVANRTEDPVPPATSPSAERAAEAVVITLRTAFRVAVFTYRAASFTFRAVLAFGRLVYVRIGEEVGTPASAPTTAPPSPPASSTVAGTTCVQEHCACACRGGDNRGRTEPGPAYEPTGNQAPHAQAPVVAADPPQLQPPTPIANVDPPHAQVPVLVAAAGPPQVQTQAQAQAHPPVADADPPQAQAQAPPPVADADPPHAQAPFTAYGGPPYPPPDPNFVTISEPNGTDDTWYLVTAGTRVGVIQGWAYVAVYTQGIRGNVQHAVRDRATGLAEWENALAAGIVRVLRP